MSTGKQVFRLGEATIYHDKRLAKQAVKVLKRDNLSDFKFKIKEINMAPEATRPERFIGSHMTTVMTRRAKRMGWEYEVLDCYKITPQGVKVPRKEIIVHVPVGENALPERLR